MVNKRDETALLRIACSAYIQVERRAVLRLGVRHKVHLLLIAEQPHITRAIHLAVERSRGAVRQVEHDSIVGKHTQVEVKVEEVGMVHLAIQLDDVPLAVIYRVVGEDD